MTDLPSGWAVTTVGDVFDVTGGGTPSTEVDDYWHGDIPWFTSADIQDTGEIRPRRWISWDAVRGSATNVVPVGSVVVVTRVGLGKVGLVVQDMAFSQDCQALLPRQGIDPQFVRYQLSAVARELKHVSRGTTISGVTKKQLLSLPLNLAPLREQERIVAAIEEQFSRLDAGVGTLFGVGEKLRRMRTVVLRRIFDGEAATGVTVPLQSVAEARLGRMLSAKRETGKYARPYLRNRDVQWGRIDTGALPVMDFNERDMERFRLQTGDVLVCEGGEIGRAAVWDAPVADCYYQKALHRVRCSPSLDPYYLRYLLEYYALAGFFERFASGSTIAHLPQEDLRNLPVPLPGIDRQRRVVRYLGDALGAIGATAGRVERLRHRSRPLRSSILAAAFSGKLVSQDPSDEPASFLLERIAAQRVASANGKRSSSRRRAQPSLWETTA